MDTSPLLHSLNEKLRDQSPSETYLDAKVDIGAWLDGDPSKAYVGWSNDWEIMFDRESGSQVARHPRDAAFLSMMAGSLWRKDFPFMEQVNRQ